MRIVIAGGSGFIGQKLMEILLDEHHECIVLTRGNIQNTGNVRYVKWLQEGSFPEKEIGEANAFINLAGVSINNGRWTKAHQKQIYESRMEATEEIIRIITALPKKPSVLINASAIGIYPSSETAIYSEESKEVANDFLAKTVRDWEKKAASLMEIGIRVAFMRFGVVLGKEGGALPLMALPYKLFVGGRMGSGKQWVSWVHVKDAVQAISFVMKNDKIQGPVNVTAPSPMIMNDFGKTIGAVLHRPHWFPVPSIVMKVALGQKSSLVLEGQHVEPEILVKNGFEFSYPTLKSALENILL